MVCISFSFLVISWSRFSRLKSLCANVMSHSHHISLPCFRCYPHLTIPSHSVPSVSCRLIVRGGGGEQAYSRLSTKHGHITDCKLDSVVYADVHSMRGELMSTCIVWAERCTPDSFCSYFDSQVRRNNYSCWSIQK